MLLKEGLTALVIDVLYCSYSLIAEDMGAVDMPYMYVDVAVGLLPTILSHPIL